MAGFSLLIFVVAAFPSWSAAEMATEEETVLTFGKSDTEVIPNRVVMKGYAFVKTTANINEVQAGAAARAAELQANTAKLLAEQAAASGKAEANASSAEATKKKEYEDAVAAARAALKRAEEEAERKQNEAEAALASQQASLATAKSELETAQRLRDEAVASELQVVATQEPIQTNCNQQILNINQDVTDKEAVVFAKKLAAKRITTKLAEEEENNKSWLRRAFESFTSVFDRTNADLERAKAAFRLAEKNLQTVQADNSGLLETSIVTQMMAEQAATSKMQAEQQRDDVQALLNGVEEMSSTIDAFYIQLDPAKELLFTGSLSLDEELFNKLQSDTVNKNDVVTGQKNVASFFEELKKNEVSIIATTKKLLGEADKIATAAEVAAEAAHNLIDIMGKDEVTAKLQLSNDDVDRESKGYLLPLCRWYVLSVKKQASAGVDACEVFKKDNP